MGVPVTQSGTRIRAQSNHVPQALHAIASASLRDLAAEAVPDSASARRGPNKSPLAASNATSAANATLPPGTDATSVTPASFG